MRRVALVVPGLEERGGVPAVAQFLARVLRESGRYEAAFVSLPMGSSDPASVRLLAPSTWRRGVRVEHGEHDGQPVLRVGARFSELEFQRYRPRRPLTRLLDGFDIVQIVAGAPGWALVAQHVRRPVALQVATLAAEERRALRSHGSLFERGWRAAMTRLTSRLEERALQRADVVFVENAWMEAHLRRRLGPARVVFAPPGVDTDLFRPPQQAPSRGHLLAVGRFADPRKRADLLFDAYRRLCESVNDAPPLVLAGWNGPSAADWALAERLGVRRRIELHERVTERELLSLYQRASALLLSSDEEGLGIVILEAMACGLPVVCTDCGGPATSVREGETGHRVPRGDAAALAARIGELLADPARRARMGERARALAVERFSLRAAGRPFLEWYDRAGRDAARG